jgi:hypothetical protein
VFDGALRKWVLPSQETVIFVLKDAVLWGAFFIYALKKDPLELPRPLHATWVPVLLVAYILVAMAQAFNLNQPNLIVSAVGLKSHLAYLPLVVLLPPIVARTTGAQIARFLWRYALFIVVPLTALSIFQFSQPPSAWINQYVEEMATGVAKMQGFPRITGTFPYIGSYIKYLQFNAVLGASTVLAGLKYGHKGLATTGGIILGGTTIVVPMTGSRSPVVVITAGLVGLFLIMRSRRYWLPLLAMALIGAFVAAEGFGDSIVLQGWEALGERTERSGLAQDRIEQFLLAPITGLEEAGLFGYGVGTNHQAASGFVSGPRWEGGIGGDNRVLRVLAELGALGFLILIFLKASLLYISFQVVQKERSPVEMIIGGTAFCVLFSYLLLPVVYNVVSGALYWGSVGGVLGIWSIQQASIQNRKVKSRVLDPVRGG